MSRGLQLFTGKVSEVLFSDRHRLLGDCCNPIIRPQPDLASTAMPTFAQMPVQQFRLNYTVRGPELAFAVPQGDLDALEEVARHCSNFWDGANSLIVPVSTNGGIPKWIDEMREETLSIERCYAHPSLEERAVAAATRRFPDCVPLYDDFYANDVHPWHLAAAPSSETKPRLAIPAYDSPSLRRFAAVAWGVLDDEDLPTWGEKFELLERDGPSAHGALLAGQVASDYTTPLRLSQKALRAIEWGAPLHHPLLMVLDGTFNDLILFWNTRASYDDLLGRPGIAAIPSKALDSPAQLQVLNNWMVVPDTFELTPDLLVFARPKNQEATTAALQEIEFQHDTPTKLSFRFGSRVVDRDSRTFTFSLVPLGGRIRRGVPESALITVTDRRARLDLDAPGEFAVRSGHTIRLDLIDLPVPFPLTAAGANRIIQNATVTDHGLTVHTAAQRSWRWDVELPTDEQLLSDWASAHGYTVDRSQDGRYGTVLLARLEGLAGLDELASDVAIKVLRALTPESRKKLAQALASQFADRQVADLDEATLVDELGRVDLMLDRPWSNLEGIRSRTGCGRQPILKTLAGLTKYGFVQSGVARRCESCNFEHFWPVSELGDVVSCPACGHQFVMPIRPQGPSEIQLSYRLDGLMARAMDQDLLPVLLALKALRPQVEERPWSAWPGLIFKKESAETDADLLIAADPILLVECKSHAEGLTKAQLDKVLELSDDLGVQPGLAALEGQFTAAQRERVERKNGRVLVGSDLTAP